MSELFADDPQQILLPGPGRRCELIYYPQFLTPQESARALQQLTAQVAWQQDQVRIGGRAVPIPRLNAWYGDVGANYGYSGIRLSPRPWFELLSALKIRVDRAAGVVFNSALLNLYRDGRDSVAWHSDDETELGAEPLIGSLSLGAERRFQLRRRAAGQCGRERFELRLGAGSLLLMSGATQHLWQHQIPKQAAVTEPRINITFRRLVG